MSDFGAPPLMASDLIDELQRLIDEHGDMRVSIASTDVSVREVIAYDSDGNTFHAPVEFALHGW